VGTGLMLSRCLEAAEALAAEGIDARVIEVHTIKPFDSETIVSAARETGALVTAEEHSIIGGLGGAVIEALAAVRPVPVERVGIADRFGTTGPYDELLALLGLAVSDIVSAAHRAVHLKRD
ncbi:MAG TPA: transketolase C-terminal domain-containing protein, partial [Candidatus Deferrimicrobium sp.]|nr:transketolase C-terminal domain-containing protein [Candidatus Deferrimicrobium sp.]